MEVFKAVVLGVVQGLTEFLPISSSGHLVLVQHMFPGDDPHALAFDVVLHVGTAVSVLAYFHRDLLGMADALVRKPPPERAYLRRWVWLLALATVPAAAIGGPFAGDVEHAFQSVRFVGVALLVTAAILYSAARLAPGRRNAPEVSWLDAFLIGMAQAVAILPGISRSGSTVTAGLWRGIERDAAARFAFLMSLPAILGAAVLNSFEIGGLAHEIPIPLAVGGLAAAITGFIAIDVTMRAVRVGRLGPFALYCAFVGALALVVGGL